MTVGCRRNGLQWNLAQSAADRRCRSQLMEILGELVAHGAWIDVIFGTWGKGVDAMIDHVSFGCRVGPVPGQASPAVSLVNSGAIYPDNALWGKKLDRKAALQHPRLAEFWAVTDFILESDSGVNSHLYGKLST